MQVSKLKLDKKIMNKMYQVFYQALGDLKGSSEAEIFVHDFLTEIERISLAKRLMTSLFLENGKSYEYIKKSLKVSSATIASVDKMMSKNSQGFALVLKKIEADRWASQTAKNLSRFVKKVVGK